MAQPALHRSRRVVALAAAALTLAGCGMNEADPNRFETLAQSVASIPVSAEDEGEARPTVTPDQPRERAEPLKVELMTPHELWDAREGVTARVRLASASTPTNDPDPEAPPAAVAAPQPAPPVRQVQLGAYSSEDGARAAWARLSRGPGGAALSGLQPAYEAVEVGGRRLIRLKVAASVEQAQALCRDLAASDPWCARSGAAA